MNQSPGKNNPSRVMVIGAGSWGTALALVLAHKNYQVKLFCNTPEQAERILSDKENRQYLPGFPLPKNIHPGSDLSLAAGCAAVVMAVPSHGFRAVFKRIIPHLSPGVGIISAAKGIENQTLMTMTRVMAEELARCFKLPVSHFLPAVCGPVSKDDRRLSPELANSSRSGPNHGLESSLLGFDPDSDNKNREKSEKHEKRETREQGLTESLFRLGALSGPSFAREVAMGLPTAVTVAATGVEDARFFQNFFFTERFRVYVGADLIGLELGGALKNIIAIAAGISDGLNYGANARAALITRGLAEITRLGVKMGASPLTFSGLAGLGDLVLTCTGALSRNRGVGLKLGQGLKLAEILAAMQMVAEGVKTTASVWALAQREQVVMPIMEQVYQVLYRDKPCREAGRDLLARQGREELEFT